jgi:GTP-binding protein
MSKPKKKGMVRVKHKIGAVKKNSKRTAEVLQKTVESDPLNVNLGGGVQFEEWGKEEEELQRRSLETEMQELAEDGITGNDLPEYMLKSIGSFEKKEGISSAPVKQGKLPTIAVVGRPNTGKSTIVNKLTNSFKDGAIVHDEPGVTRDRTYRLGEWQEYNFQVIDTGGIVFDDTEDEFASRITAQAMVAIEEATVVMLVVDGQAGISPLDYSLAKWLRRYCQLPIFLCVNKCESHVAGITQAQEFWQLGMGDPWPVSGIHGTGLAQVLDEVVTKMDKITEVEKEVATNVAFVGRPNVGKSSLFNRFMGMDRAIVSDVAGTTRDTVDSLITRERGNGEEKKYRIIDTAGIRKKKKVEYGSEFFMINRAFKAMKRADTVVLMLDAANGIVDQDRILAERISSEGRSCVIALNKWDLIPNKDENTFQKAVDHIRSSLPTLKWAEVAVISAATGQRTEKLLEAIDKSSLQFSKRVSTNVLNEVVNDATMWMAPPTIRSRSGKIYYALQVSTAPPTFVFFVNDPKLFTDSYQRFLERKIRDSLDFSGTPLKFIWRGKQLRDVARVAAKGDRMTSNRPLQGVMGMGGAAAGIAPGLNPRNADGNEVTTGKSPNRKQSKGVREDRNSRGR